MTEPVRMASLGALVGVTIVGPDLDTWLAAYRDHLGYRIGASGVVGAAQAQAWRRPATEVCRTATLYPASGSRSFVRFVESDVEPVTPLASAGWAAAEIVVQDLDGLADALAGSSFRIIGPPAVLDFDFTDKISAMQVVGPAGEVLYLTQIDGEIPGFDLPTADCPVDSLFVAVLGTTDLAATADWYAAQFGVAVTPPIHAAVAVISDAHRLPVDLRHRLQTFALPAATLVEIDEYPAASTLPRPVAACGLPGGIAMFSFLGSGELVEGPAGELIERSGTER